MDGQQRYSQTGDDNVAVFDGDNSIAYATAGNGNTASIAGDEDIA